LLGLFILGNSAWRSCEKTKFSSHARGPSDRAPSTAIRKRLPPWWTRVFLSVSCPRPVTGPHLSAALLEEQPFPISLQRRETAVPRRNLGRDSTGAKRRRSGGAGGDLVVLACGGGGGLGRWSVEVVSGEGGGVGQRRGSRRHQAASTTASSMATHPSRRSILHGARISTAQQRSRRSICRGAASSTAQHRGRREICTAFSLVSFSPA
jgi:hypothetical protein